MSQRLSNQHESQGDPRPVTMEQVLKSESGMMTFGTIFAVMVLLIFLSFIANSVNTVNQKIETQNGADAVAYSSSVWVARVMNAVTASNHIIGELNAIWIYHHAFGGKRLDEKFEANSNTSPTFKLTGMTTSSTCKTLNSAIDPLFSVCQSAVVPSMSFHKSIIKDQDPKSDVNSTLFRGMHTLKMQYAITLGVHAAGWGIYQIPDPFGISKVVGTAIMVVALAVEFKIWQEYLILIGVEMLAKGLSIPKKAIPAIMDTIYIYQNVEVVARIPLQAYLCADSVAEKHLAEGFVRGDTPDGLPSDVQGAIDEFSKFYPKLPIEKETQSNVKRCQLMRATYPWVCHWRYRPRQFFKWTCTMSMAAAEYTKWTNEWTLQNCERFRMKSNQTYNKQLLKVDGKGQADEEMRPFKNTPLVFDEGMKLYVMLDLNEHHKKSNEKWNKDNITGTHRSDELFCLMGFAKREPTWVASPAFFRQENPHGFACYSQAMIYNANPQPEPSDQPGDGDKQLDVGWDTLNWDQSVSGSNPIEYTTDEDYQDPPRIKPNWQAKLCPLTAPKMAKTLTTTAITDQDMQKILLNGGLEQFALQNH